MVCDAGDPVCSGPGQCPVSAWCQPPLSEQLQLIVAGYNGQISGDLCLGLDLSCFDDINNSDFLPLHHLNPRWMTITGVNVVIIRTGHHRKTCYPTKAELVLVAWEIEIVCSAITYTQFYIFRKYFSV